MDICFDMSHTWLLVPLFRRLGIGPTWMPFLCMVGLAASPTLGLLGMLGGAGSWGGPLIPVVGAYLCLCSSACWSAA